MRYGYLRATDYVRFLESEKRGECPATELEGVQLQSQPVSSALLGGRTTVTPIGGGQTETTPAQKHRKQPCKGQVRLLHTEMGTKCSFCSFFYHTFLLRTDPLAVESGSLSEEVSKHSSFVNCFSVSPLRSQRLLTPQTCMPP